MLNKEIKRTVTKMGNDYAIQVFGGEQAHIGTTVIAQPVCVHGEWKVTTNVWNRLGHRDDEIALRYAKAVSLATKSVVVCTCGIHYPNITYQKITAILAWCETDIQALIKELTNDESTTKI